MHISARTSTLKTETVFNEETSAREANVGISSMHRKCTLTYCALMLKNQTNEQNFLSSRGTEEYLSINLS